jgi:hypothetical protein
MADRLGRNPHDHQPNTNAQLARANVAFIVHGDPRLDLVQGNG